MSGQRDPFGRCASRPTEEEALEDVEAAEEVDAGPLTVPVRRA